MFGFLGFRVENLPQFFMVQFPVSGGYIPFGLRLDKIDLIVLELG